eukprot:m.61914 g.61914  ORF g.61914 m.61914 type:complete len:510 (-) comp15780_c0_seq1:380-1909(-)
MFSCMYYHGPQHICGGKRRHKRNAVGPDPSWRSDNDNGNLQDSAPAGARHEGSSAIQDNRGASRVPARRQRKLKAPTAATIVILGLDKAGKSTVMLSLQNGHVQNALPTLGFVHDEIKFKRCWMTVYDLGGSEKIRAIWPNYFAEAHGFVFVVDASARERLEEARVCLEQTMQHAFVTGKSVVVLINKVDQDGAMTKHEVLRGLRVVEARDTTCVDQRSASTHDVSRAPQASTHDTLAPQSSDGNLGPLNEQGSPPRVLVEVCSAIHSKPRHPDPGIKLGLWRLLDAIRRQGPGLSDRRERDLVVHREHMATEQAARRERVRLRREERERAKAAAAASDNPDTQGSNAPSSALDPAIDHTADSTRTDPGDSAMHTAIDEPQGGKKLAWGSPSPTPSSTARDSHANVPRGTPDGMDHTRLALSVVTPTPTRATAGAVDGATTESALPDTALSPDTGLADATTEAAHAPPLGGPLDTANTRHDALDAHCARQHNAEKSAFKKVRRNQVVPL